MRGIARPTSSPRALVLHRPALARLGDDSRVAPVHGPASRRIYRRFGLVHGPGSHPAADPLLPSRWPAGASATSGSAPRSPSSAEHRQAVNAEAEALRRRARGAAPAARSAFPVQRAERRGRGDPRASRRRRSPCCAISPPISGIRSTGIHQTAWSPVEVEAGDSRPICASSRRASASGCATRIEVEPAAAPRRSPASCCSRWSRTP